jgi:hypothetical protein
MQLFLSVADIQSIMSVVNFINKRSNIITIKLECYFNTKLISLSTQSFCEIFRDYLVFESY